MKHLALISICLLASCASITDRLPGSGDLRERLSADIGERVFEHRSANSIDEQVKVGLEYSAWREDGVYGFDFGVHYHQDSATMPVFGLTKMRGVEITGGLRRTFPIEGSPFTPYIGLGISGWAADRDEEFPSTRDGTEAGFAIYERIGVTAPISDHLYVGIDVRYIQEDFLSEGDLNMDGDAVSFILGMRL